MLLGDCLSEKVRIFCLKYYVSLLKSLIAATEQPLFRRNGKNFYSFNWPEKYLKISKRYYENSLLVSIIDMSIYMFQDDEILKKYNFINKINHLAQNSKK